MAQAFDWLKPSLLWRADVLDFRQPDFFQPQLFRFDSDEFMEQFLAAVAAPGPDALEKALAVAPDTQPLKLFQPIHGSFYLAAGSLCCREPGFPDRMLDAANGENVFFVLRKLIGGEEYAWVPEGERKGWNYLNGQARTVLDGEDRLPLFRTNRPCGRSLFVGYVPVSSRETYNIAPVGLAALTGDKPTDIEDGRIEQLRSRFIDQLAQLPLPSIMRLPNTPQNIDRTISVYLLLELWELLAEPNVLPDLAAVLRGDTSATLTTENLQAKNDLLAFLEEQIVQGTFTLRAALAGVASKQAALNQRGAVPADLGFDANYNLRGAGLDTDTLEQKVRAALPAAGQPYIELPKLEPRSDARYVLRFVYERPQCDLKQQYVSRPSVDFVLAPFFDAGRARTFGQDSAANRCQPGEYAQVQEERQLHDFQRAAKEDQCRYRA